MQSFSHDENWANQMGEQLDLSQSSYPDMGFEGVAGVGLHNRFGFLDPINPSSYRGLSFGLDLNFAISESPLREYGQTTGLLPPQDHGFKDGSFNDVPFENDGAASPASQYKAPTINQNNTRIGQFNTLQNTYHEQGTPVLNQISAGINGFSVPENFYQEPSSATFGIDDMFAGNAMFNNFNILGNTYDSPPIAPYGFPNTSLDAMFNNFPTLDAGDQVLNMALAPPVLPAPAPTSVHAPTRSSTHPFQCRVAGCGRNFTRNADLVRHDTTVHRRMVRGQQHHLCPINGCPKAAGRGYSRPDKVTEHLWKKHADLGYTKA